MYDRCRTWRISFLRYKRYSNIKNRALLGFFQQISNLQHLIRQELINAKSDFDSRGSAALLMNANTGEILSLVSLPDFDINHRTLINEDMYTNKITLGVYELGSVFKTFTLAAALENKIIKSNTVFKNLESYLKSSPVNAPF